MKKCAICGKKNAPGNGTFFQIPNDERRRHLWSKSCRKELKQTALICVDHFLPKDLIVGTRCKLMPSAVPSIGIVMEMTINTPAKNEVIVGNCPLVPNRCEKKEVVVGNYPMVSNRCEKKEVVVGNYPIIPNRCEAVGAQEDPPCVYEVIEYETNDSVAELEEKLVDCCTQTDNNIVVSISETENYKLRREVKQLQNENSKLKEALEVANTTIANMKKFFTENQIRKMGNPEKRINWRSEDISAGMGLLSSGPRAYNHLYMKGFPLPNVSSLQRWARKSEFNSGILNVSLDANDDNVGVINKQPKNCSKK